METLTVCGLCLQENYLKWEVPQETLKMLKILNVSNSNLGQPEDLIFCTSCVEKVKGAFDFKVRCLEGENNWVSKATQVIDKVLCENLVECRLCNNCVTRNSTVLLMERLKENNVMTAFHKYLPEIDLKSIKNPVICEPCQMLLSNFSNFVFLLSRINAENKENKGIFQLLNMEDSTHLKNKIHKVDKPEIKLINPSSVCEDINKSDAVEVKIETSEDSESKTAVTKIKREVNLEDNCNTVQIKTEIDSDTTFSECTTMGIKVDNEPINEYENTDDVNFISSADIKEILLNEYTEDKLKYEEMDIKSEPEQSMSERSGIEEILEQSTHFKDQIFTYDPICQKFNHHVLSKEINANEKKIHKCQECTYQTTLKQSLQRHMVTHKHPDETEMYKCPQCSFQTKFKQSLKTHMINHKNADEVEMYKCPSCNYQTKFKHHLKGHMIIHKNSDEVTTYKCQKCIYQTKFQRHLKNHLITHKNSDEVEMNKCHQCTFQTKFKYSLGIHMLIHKNSDEVEMHKCPHCSFQTKRKQSLKGHMIIHKNSDEVTMYKCHLCSHQTKFKHNLKPHMLTHKNLDEIVKKI